MESCDPQQVATDREITDPNAKQHDPPDTRLGAATAAAAVQARPFDQDVANPEMAGEVPLGEDASALGGGDGEGP
ncbi:MAG TPA: hypothetical protein VH482_06445 [Thermomicrobiales bacterium]|jgi:hypothetical protein